MKLMIVESPNKIKKIKSILDSLGDSLGRGTWEVAASVGHIRDLPVKELGIALPAYTPVYELTERGRDVVRRLKLLASRAEEIYLATDPDREGEAISWHLKEVLGKEVLGQKTLGQETLGKETLGKETLGRDRYQRVTFDAITPSVIARALAAPRAINDNLVQAQEARRVLDRLVGYQVSPVLSRQTGRMGLSAGRVQSPAVRLVVDREREIAAFVETKHFGAEVSFEANAWRAQWESAPFLPKGEKYLMDRSLAERAAACRWFAVESSENRQALQPPPPPFTTSTLLQAASISLGLKPDVTAQLAQKLFEAGLITYHRTDSQNFSAEAIKELRSFAAGRKLPLPASGRHFKARSGAQEAHEAIRPTHFPAEQAGDDRLQQAVYRLIWQRAVASQLADALYSVNTLKLAAQGEAGLAPPRDGGARGAARRFTFKAIGRTLVEPGWKALTAKDEAEEDEPAQDGDSENGGRVPLLVTGSAAQAESGRVLLKQTRPPSRYTQASLIKKLESIGIGRPSTYPAILKNVLTRAYLEEDRKFLLPTELGCLVVDTLEPRFRFLDYTFTRELEQQLDDIAEGKVQYRDVVAAADAQLQQELALLHGGPRARSSAGPAQAAARAAQGPERGGSAGSHSPPVGGWRAPLGQVGNKAASRDLGTASGASRKSPARRRAATTMPPAAPGPAPKAKRPESKTRTAHPQTPPKGAALTTSKTSSQTTFKTTFKTTSRKEAAAASRKEAAAHSHDQVGAALPCPHCKQGTLRLSPDEKRFFCTRYKEGCGFTIQTSIAGRRTKTADLAALSAKGRTAKLSGFLSKTGRPFEAILVLNETGKVEFSFAPR